MRDKAPLFICILNGAYMFTSDLMKKINIPGTTLTFFRVSSYEGITTTGKVKKIMGFTEDITDRNVVVVEDIIDTGITIVEVLAQINMHKPKAVYLSSLLYKPNACKKRLHIDYLGFKIPDQFVVGYGLDYDSLGRNLKSIYAFKEQYTIF